MVRSSTDKTANSQLVLQPGREQPASKKRSRGRAVGRVRKEEWQNCRMVPKYLSIVTFGGKL